MIRKKKSRFFFPLEWDLKLLSCSGIFWFETVKKSARKRCLLIVDEEFSSSQLKSFIIFTNLDEIWKTLTIIFTLTLIAFAEKFGPDKKLHLSVVFVQIFCFCSTLNKKYLCVFTYFSQEREKKRRIIWWPLNSEHSRIRQTRVEIWNPRYGVLNIKKKSKKLWKRNSNLFVFFKNTCRIVFFIK